MSLSESLPELERVGHVETVEPAAPVDPTLARLRDSLRDVLAVEGEEHRAHRGRQRVYVFRGRLQAAPGEAFERLTRRFAAQGYTALLQREDGDDTVIAVEGTLPERRVRTRWWLHLTLLMATLLTTTIAGAALNGFPFGVTRGALEVWDAAVLQSALRAGLPFSLTLLAILGVHEMGHYVAARLHGVRVTLPFFIPLPLPGSLGTLGAVIFIRSPLLNRRMLFDVGVAGPLAGLALALPLYLIGLASTPAMGPSHSWLRLGILRVANPPLLEWIAPLVTQTDNLDRFVLYRHPMALAAWFGVLLTALNLLPLGQFDGGHVAYAVLGRRAAPLALGTFFLLLALGLFGMWLAWLLWAFMGLLMGLRHPPPHDDVTPLGPARTVVGVATGVLFALIFVPVPFYAP